MTAPGKATPIIIILFIFIFIIMDWSTVFAGVTPNISAYSAHERFCYAANAYSLLVCFVVADRCSWLRHCRLYSPDHRHTRMIWECIDHCHTETDSTGNTLQPRS